MEENVNEETPTRVLNIQNNDKELKHLSGKPQIICFKNEPHLWAHYIYMYNNTDHQENVAMEKSLCKL